MKAFIRNADGGEWSGDDAGRKPATFAVGLVGVLFAVTLVVGGYFGLVYLTVRVIRAAWEH